MVLLSQECVIDALKIELGKRKNTLTGGSSLNIPRITQSFAENHAVFL